MTKLKEIYRCPICGNIVEVVHQSGGTLSCCGKPMELLLGNTQDGATEKHIPVIESIDGGYKIKVGSVEHPMEPAHYIEWIELITETEVLRKHLSPGEKPEAIFFTKEKIVAAREYCSIHGLWKTAK